MAKIEHFSQYAIVFVPVEKNSLSEQESSEKVCAKMKVCDSTIYNNYGGDAGCVSAIKQGYLSPSDCPQYNEHYAFLCMSYLESLSCTDFFQEFENPTLHSCQHLCVEDTSDSGDSATDDVADTADSASDADAFVEDFHNLIGEWSFPDMHSHFSFMYAGDKVMMDLSMNGDFFTFDGGTFDGYNYTGIYTYYEDTVEKSANGQIAFSVDVDKKISLIITGDMPLGNRNLSGGVEEKNAMCGDKSCGLIDVSWISGIATCTSDCTTLDTSGCVQ